MQTVSDGQKTRTLNKLTVWGIIGFIAVTFVCLLYSFHAVKSWHTYQVTDFTLVDGSVYTGEMYDGNPNGAGELIFADGSKLSGSFNDGRFEGYAIIEANAKWRFEGEFAGQSDLHGIFTSSDNMTTYHGQLLNGLPDGYSVLTITDSFEYDGDFKLGNQTGNGEFTFADGSKYTGYFSNGLAEGQGKYQDSSGWEYEGSFASGKFAGEGKIRYDNGEELQGNFSENTIVR
jgi:hypothetical protein